MAAQSIRSIGVVSEPKREALILLEQQQEVVLEATVRQGRTEAIDGPTLQIDWTPLHAVMNIIVNALAHTGAVPAEILQTRERYVRGSHGMNLLLELRVSEAVEAETLDKLGALAEYTLTNIMRKPAARVGNQLALIGDKVDNQALTESIERDLDRLGGRNFKAKVLGQIHGREPVILQGALGRKRDKSNYTPQHKNITGTIRGVINEPSQRCLLFRPSEGAVTEIYFEEGQIDTQVNLEMIAQLNKFQTVCTVKVSVTIGPRGQTVYGFGQLKAEPPPAALLTAQ